MNYHSFNDLHSDVINNEMIIIIYTNQQKASGRYKNSPRGNILTDDIKFLSILSL